MLAQQTFSYPYIHHRFSPASDIDSGNDEDEADKVGEGDMAGALAAEWQGSASLYRPIKNQS